jgi:monovalent cation/hydrogen antiporter
MHGSEIDYLELVLLGLLIIVAALVLVAKKLRIAYPIVLVLGGLLLSLVPRIPRVSMNPDLVILVILPPLVFSAAFHTSWREFRGNLFGIIMLAFGLVGFTMFGVAAVMHFLIPGFGWELGLMLGALVAATDAIAATAVAKRLGLPRRITDLLEAESLVNDGSGLVALKFTLAMVITGVTPSFTAGLATLLYLVIAAVVIGLVIGWIVRLIQQRVDDAPVEITISLITPFVVYLTAERLGCSGVLATLACGLYLGRRSSLLYSLDARIESSAVWRTLDFVLNGLVFLILGLQLPYILRDLKGSSAGPIVLDGAIFSAAVVLLRYLWIYPGEWISWRLERIRNKDAPKASSREVFLIGWAGMRGALALAAAFSLPETLPGGAPFPYRNVIIFLTFCVIFTTLVLQGLTMPLLIRLLKLGPGDTRPHIMTSAHREERFAREQMNAAALEELEAARERATAGQGATDRDEIFDRLASLYQQRLSIVKKDQEEQTDRGELERASRERRLAQQLRDVERAVAVRLRDENKIHDEVWRRLEHELDLLDARFRES